MFLSSTEGAGGADGVQEEETIDSGNEEIRSGQREIKFKSIANKILEYVEPFADKIVVFYGKVMVYVQPVFDVLEAAEPFVETVFDTFNFCERAMK